MVFQGTNAFCFCCLLQYDTRTSMSTQCGRTDWLWVGSKQRLGECWPCHWWHVAGYMLRRIWLWTFHILGCGLLYITLVLRCTTIVWMSAIQSRVKYNWITRKINVLHVAPAILNLCRCKCNKSCCVDLKEYLSSHLNASCMELLTAETRNGACAKAFRCAWWRPTTQWLDEVMSSWVNYWLSCLNVHPV